MKDARHSMSFVGCDASTPETRGLSLRLRFQTTIRCHKRRWWKHPFAAPERRRSAVATHGCCLVQTPYVRLLAIPGINVVSAAELAGEMGPIEHYANANAITGRSGLYPSRHQSDQTDNDSGSIIRQANRRLRCVLMRIAENLACHCRYYRGQADLDESRGVDKRASRVKIAKRFSRLVIACVAGDEPLRHPCFQEPDSILEKLRKFHQQHQTPLEGLLAELEAAVDQLPYNARSHEAEIVAEALQHQTDRPGVKAIGDLLPAVLARLGINTESEKKMGIGPEPV